MTDLDAPTSAEELYEARAAEVSPARPLLQGDVFKDVLLPEFDDAPGLAMIVSHACAMRAGPELKTYVTLCRVKDRQQSIQLREWANKYFYVMPLPELLDRPEATPFLYADFNEVTAVRSDHLDRMKRIACLSEYGLQLLQQRQAFHYTRVAVDLPTIEKQLGPITIETELSQDWVEAALEANSVSGDPMPFIVAQEKEFHQFLGSSGDSRLRQQLTQRHRQASVRKEVRQEIRRRFHSSS